MTPLQQQLFKGKYRNMQCGCGSGEKFKKCCYNKLQGYIYVDKLWKKVDNTPQVASIR